LIDHPQSGVALRLPPQSKALARGIYVIQAGFPFVWLV
jgi:hypothetical protein